jgi:hypothetical protein
MLVTFLCCLLHRNNFDYLYNLKQFILSLQMPSAEYSAFLKFLYNLKQFILSLQMPSAEYSAF